MKKLALLALLLSTTAYAQDAAQPTETPAPVAAPTQPPAAMPAPVAAPAVPANYYFELTPADLNALAQGLNELPKKIADPILMKMDAQMRAQQPKIEDGYKAAVAPKPPAKNRK